jgi:hypothetical protein
MKRNHVLTIVFLTVIAVLLSAPLLARAASTATTTAIPTAVAAAEQLYAQRDYALAAASYRQLADQGIADGRLYYNMGLAYRQAGDLGNALWSARAAQQLAPRDADVRALLADIQRALAAQSSEANSGVEAQPLPAQLVDFVQRWLTTNELAWLASGAWTVFALLLLAAMLATPGRLKMTAKRAAVVAGAGFMAIALVWANQSIGHTAQAVVIAPVVEVRSGPGAAFPVGLTLPAGVEVHTGERKGEWAQVALADGVQGWAPSDALLALPFGG